MPLVGLTDLLEEMARLNDRVRNLRIKIPNDLPYLSYKYSEPL